VRALAAAAAELSRTPRPKSPDAESCSGALESTAAADAVRCALSAALGDRCALSCAELDFSAQAPAAKLSAAPQQTRVTK